jgi:hypothetical protein
LTWFLAVEGIEEALEEHRRHRPDASGEMHGLWDSPAWRQMGDYLNPDDTSLNLVFAFFMDWFNPFTNKQAGKKISLGALMLTCLNLPKAERRVKAFLFLAGMAPGPKEANVVDIMNILEYLVGEFIQLQEGVLIPTPHYPNGRLVRCRLIAIIGNLVALRKVQVASSVYAQGKAGHL